MAVLGFHHTTGFLRYHWPILMAQAQSVTIVTDSSFHAFRLRQCLGIPESSRLELALPGVV